MENKTINEKVIFECIVGSHAYGTNTETSDIDIKGVYQQSNSDILCGFKYIPQIEITKDITYFEIKRFLELASSCNPTMLEMLFVDEKFIKINTEQFDVLRKNRHLFLTKECKNSFGGYAVGQIKRSKGLNKKMNWEKEKTIRKTPLDFCYIIAGNKSKPLIQYLKEHNMKQEYCGLSAVDHFPGVYFLYYDWNAEYGKDLNKPIPPLGFKGIAFDDSNSIRLSSIPKEIADSTNKIEVSVYYNKDAYSLHCKEYNQYQNWLENRNTTRYVDTEIHGQQIDGKNLMHCMRLINCGLEIATTGNLSVLRPERDELLNIRTGKCDLEHVIKEAEEKLKQMDEAFEKSDLPDSFDMNIACDLLLKIRNK